MLITKEQKLEKLNTYKVNCRMDGKESITTVKAHNTNDALMTYLKSVSRVDGKIPKDYKIDITLAQELLMAWWEIPLYAGALWLCWKLLVVLVEVIRSCWR